MPGITNTGYGGIKNTYRTPKINTLVVSTSSDYAENESYLLHRFYYTSTMINQTYTSSTCFSTEICSIEKSLINTYETTETILGTSTVETSSTYETYSDPYDTGTVINTTTSSTYKSTMVDYSSLATTLTNVIVGYSSISASLKFDTLNYNVVLNEYENYKDTSTLSFGNIRYYQNDNFGNQRNGFAGNGLETVLSNKMYNVSDYTFTFLCTMTWPNGGAEQTVITARMPSLPSASYTYWTSTVIPYNYKELKETTLETEKVVSTLTDNYETVFTSYQNPITSTTYYTVENDTVKTTIQDTEPKEYQTTYAGSAYYKNNGYSIERINTYHTGRITCISNNFYYTYSLYGTYNLTFNNCSYNLVNEIGENYYGEAAASFTTQLTKSWVVHDLMAMASYSVDSNYLTTAVNYNNVFTTITFKYPSNSITHETSYDILRNRTNTSYNFWNSTTNMEVKLSYSIPEVQETTIWKNKEVAKTVSNYSYITN